MPAVPDASTLLVTITGRDRPGVTSTLFTALANHPLDVLDVERAAAELTLGGSEPLSSELTPRFAAAQAFLN